MPRNPGIKTEDCIQRFRWHRILAAPFFQALDSRVYLPICFTVFIGLRAAVIFFLPVEPSSDASWYFNRAVSIASGEGYSEEGYPTAYWPVGYPGFLGVLFYIFWSSELVGQLANLLMAAGTFFLQLELTRKIFNSEAAARLGVFLLTIYPNNITYTSFLLTEIYFTFLLLLGIYLYIVWRGWGWVLLCGIVFGLATLTKPQAVFLPGLLVLFRLFSNEERINFRENILKGVFIYLIMAAVMIPWAIRNGQVFGKIVLISTNGGATLLTGNNPSANGGYVEDDSLVIKRNFSVRDQVESDRRAKELAFQWIQENPVRFFELIPFKIWHLWARNGEAEWAYQAGYQHYDQYQYVFRTLRWINQVFYSLLLFGSFLAFFLLISDDRKAMWPWVFTGYCLIIYLTIISVVFSGQPRFHFSAMPWVIMQSAWAAVMFSSRYLPRTIR